MWGFPTRVSPENKALLFLPRCSSSHRWLRLIWRDPIVSPLCLWFPLRLFSAVLFYTMSSNGQVWERVYIMSSHLPVCTYSYVWMCVFLGLLSHFSLVQDQLWFTCALRQCGALWFPVPQLDFLFPLFFLLIMFDSVSASPPPLLLYQLSFVFCRRRLVEYPEGCRVKLIF